MGAERYSTSTSSIGRPPLASQAEYGSDNVDQQRRVAQLAQIDQPQSAPWEHQFRVVLSDQPDQVTRFFSAWPAPIARQAVVRLRVRDPSGARRLDDYSFTLGALSAPQLVRVSAFDDIDAEGFASNEVPGLAHIEGIVDTALVAATSPTARSP
ncbi:hypothetical protein [Nocardia abscessus]|uniref:hypothetical protein n=1 Tax=Nocardia abscessus TaxID=120957 RepID=UPI002456A376|nr:hypothetical protein [Nocardia abscessus]